MGRSSLLTPDRHKAYLTSDLKMQIKVKEFADPQAVVSLLEKDIPLAGRLRPSTLDEFIGQSHLVGQDKLLRRMIEADRIRSVILYGPPGTGKTSLAHIIAQTTQSHFSPLSAVTSGVADLRQVIEAAKLRRRHKDQKTILFIDEIHRFNKAQQDVLLPHVEDGTIILVGATIENPFFYVISPLLSRSRVFELKPLRKDELRLLLERALRDPKRGLGLHKVVVEEPARQFLIQTAAGDGRRLLNALELAVLTTPPTPQGIIQVTLAVAEESVQKRAVHYDREGDQHYDIISAFIKSMRGSDPDAALYWLARMIYAGEDPRFIARRIVICAAEDVGNADAQALVLANAALSAAEFVGMPEAQILLAQAAVYVATAPKSNASYRGLLAALKDIENGHLMEVPDALKDASYTGAKRLQHGVGYQYVHDYPEGFVRQTYIPEQRSYYRPSSRGYEAIIGKRLKMWWGQSGQESRQTSDERPS